MTLNQAKAWTMLDKDLWKVVRFDDQMVGGDIILLNANGDIAKIFGNGSMTIIPAHTWHTHDNDSVLDDDDVYE